MSSHDVEEYRGDGTEMCCVDGCEQKGCPGQWRKPQFHERGIAIERHDDVGSLEACFAWVIAQVDGELDDRAMMRITIQRISVSRADEDGWRHEWRASVKGQAKQ